MVVDKENCCGCGACANICPKQCISMKPDEEGFLYPTTDREHCVFCGMCEKVCPVIHHTKLKARREEAYAVRHKDNRVRDNSSSGGMFYLLAQHTIASGGLVIGAAFDDDFVLRHKAVSDMDDLMSLLGSKYVQSDTQQIYKLTKESLQSGRQVLFSGTPCQVEALYRYLGKSYDNLTTVDIICHGVPSPLQWERYKQWRTSQRKNTRMVQADFRDKSAGWRHYSLMLRFDNGSIHKGIAYDDPLTKAYRMELCSRPSCYGCPFKGALRMSDITLGDFWGIEKVLRAMDDDRGTSLVILHSEKGANLFRSLEAHMEAAEVDLNEALQYNGAALRPPQPSERRDAYMKDMTVMDFGDLTRKYCSDDCFTACKKLVKKIIKKIIRR